MNWRVAHRSKRSFCGKTESKSFTTVILWRFRAPFWIARKRARRLVRPTGLCKGATRSRSTPTASSRATHPCHPEPRSHVVPSHAPTSSRAEGEGSLAASQRRSFDSGLRPPHARMHVRMLWRKRYWIDDMVGDAAASGRDDMWGMNLIGRSRGRRVRSQIRCCRRC